MDAAEYAAAQTAFDQTCTVQRALAQIAAAKGKGNAHGADAGLGGETPRCPDYESDDEGVHCNGGVGVQSPNRGVWWEVFYKRMYEDRARWRAVKRAMGRGKCRVVVRWVEFAEGEGDGDGDGDADADVDMGSGRDAGGDGDVFGLRRIGGLSKDGSASPGAGGRLDGRTGGNRVTRSEVRRRSGFGSGSSGTGLGGEGLLGVIGAPQTFGENGKAKDKWKGRSR